MSVNSLAPKRTTMDPVRHLNLTTGKKTTMATTPRTPKAPALKKAPAKKTTVKKQADTFHPSEPGLVTEFVRAMSETDVHLLRCAYTDMITQMQSPRAVGFDLDDAHGVWDRQEEARELLAAIFADINDVRALARKIYLRTMTADTVEGSYTFTFIIKGVSTGAAGDPQTIGVSLKTFGLAKTSLWERMKANGRGLVTIDTQKAAIVG